MDDDENDGEDARNCKVVLLGESGVGKTSIISRFINDTFEEGLVTTTGASYAGKDMEFKDYQNQVIRFEIWDTAGQEKYRSLAQIFYKDAAIAILVYDITNEESFEEIQKYWYNQLKECASKDIIIGLAANKCDLIDSEKVSEQKARDFAKEIGAIFKLTSACKSIGIEELFVGVGCKFLDPNYKEDDNKKPEVKVIEEPKLEEKKEENNVVIEAKKENKAHDNIKLNPNAVVAKKKKKKFC
jgi:Ras-related protein Rab-22